MKKQVFIFFLSLLTTIQLVEGGNTGLAFLKIGVDARAVAMGEAYSAVCNDAAATYWNPAGLARAGTNSIVLMHNSWLQDINHEFLTVQLFHGRHNLAIAVNLIQVTGIQLRGEQAAVEPIGTSSAANMYLGLNYATQVASDWSIGGQLKYLYEKYYLTAAEGFALDVGIRRSNMLPGVEWGLSIQNLGKMNKLRTQSTPLPVIIRLGVSYVLPLQVFKYRPLTAVDVYYINSDKVHLNLGTDLPVTQNINLRVGYILGGDSYSVTTGFGITFWKVSMAYAFVPYRYDLGQSHRFSLLLYF
jgi:hypothetical protein